MLWLGDKIYKSQTWEKTYRQNKYLSKQNKYFSKLNNKQPNLRQKIWTFTQEDSLMTNKTMKRCSVSLVIKEIPMQTAVR